MYMFFFQGSAGIAGGVGRRRLLLGAGLLPLLILLGVPS